MAVRLKACLAASVTVSPLLREVWLQFGFSVGVDPVRVSEHCGCRVPASSTDLLPLKFKTAACYTTQEPQTLNNNHTSFSSNIFFLPYNQGHILSCTLVC